MGAAVLVVDDDDDIREALVQALKEYDGYTVYEAPDGAPALERLRTHPEGLVVLLDLNMPGVDGGQVIQAIEQDAVLATRHAYILLTAREGLLPPGLEERLARLSIPVIGKPFDLDQVLGAVATAAARLRVEW